MAADAPHPASERLAILDVLRGGALFGVLLSNAHAIFNAAWFAPTGAPAPTRTDAAARWAIETFVAGKAMTLLTLLFGLGFALQLARGVPTAGFVRRQAALFAIGAAHALLLWWGDVTWNYAVVGLALLAFRRSSPRALLAWGTALVLVPQLLNQLPAVRAALQPLLPAPADRGAYYAELVATLRGTDYGAVIAAHAVHVGYHVSRIAPWYVGWLLGRFVLGTYAARRGWFARDGADHLPVFRRLLAWGAALGVLGAVVDALAEALIDAYGSGGGPWISALARAVLGEAATLGATVAYASAAVLGFQRARGRRLLLVVAPVGRMPLTTYLAQSVACGAVFYGWGLGAMGRLGAAEVVALCGALFALQIAAATWWLRRYRFGPVEWLWRSLAYGSRPPMRIG